MSKLKHPIENYRNLMRRIVCRGGVGTMKQFWGVPPGWGRLAEILMGVGRLLKNGKPDQRTHGLPEI